jgi:prepilin-type N-terminal cleavage/methylation domain-containing protein
MMRGNRRRGFTLVEIMIVVLIIGILLSIAVPQFMTARLNASKKTCQSNLRVFDESKAQFAIENNAASGDPVNLADLAPYLRDIPSCPMGGTYTFNTVGTLTECSEPDHPHPEL